ncbi:hypothetical protein SAMN04487901_10246 [Prevotella communis]|uniref:Uncharacterized protein n=1 Tax=Prevotella communis TaxID=2913614 RepID=A0A1G7SXQ2_9BACT|nr:hypothetical protein SAMN04487901_10246 [Prevotella communis]
MFLRANIHIFRDIQSPAARNLTNRTKSQKIFYLFAYALHKRAEVKFLVLVGRSGYRSYSTFSLAFKQYTGFSVTNWMYKEAGSSSAGASAATP